MVASRIIVSYLFRFYSRFTHSYTPPGFVYRHTAAGPPTEGLHAYYDISSELGKGSFATVMKAVSRATGEWFAVKMIHDNKMIKTTADGPAAAAAAANNNANNNNNNAARTNAFAREISILEKLKHPNICQLKEVFFQDGNISFVLSYLFHAVSRFADPLSRSSVGARRRR